MADFQKVALLCRLTKFAHYHVKGRRELTEDKGEENRLPAREVTENSFDGIRLAFRNSANPRHPLPSKLDFLNDKTSVSYFSLFIWTSLLYLHVRRTTS